MRNDGVKNDGLITLTTLHDYYGNAQQHLGCPGCGATCSHVRNVLQYVDDEGDAVLDIMFECECCSMWLLHLKDHEGTLVITCTVEPKVANE